MEFTSSCEDASPTMLVEPVIVASELPGPSPQHRPVTDLGDLGSIEGRSFVKGATVAWDEPGDCADDLDVTDHPCHPRQVGAVAVTPPQRHEQHPLSIDLYQVGAFPDVGWGDTSGDWVIDTQQGAQGLPGSQVVGIQDNNPRQMMPST